MLHKLFGSTRRPFHLIIIPALFSLACVCGGSFIILPTPMPTLPAPVQWSVSLQPSVMSRPTYADGLLIFKGISGDGALYAIDAASGQLAWTTELTAYTSADDIPLAVSNDVVVAFQEASSNTRLIAVDAKTGTVLWELPLSIYTGLAYPQAADDKLFFQSKLNNYSFKFAAFDIATGNMIWEAGDFENWLDTTPLIVGDKVIITSLSGAKFDNPPPDQNLLTEVIALNTDTGDLLWQAEIDATPSNLLTADNDRVYVTTEEGAVYAFDLNTGNLAWEASPTAFELASPTVADGVVYVGAQDSVLYALDAATGGTLWSFSTAPGGIRTQPAISNGVIYFGNMAGYLYAVDVQTHSERWSTRNPLRQPGAFSGLGDYYPPLDVSPVIVGNRLYYYNYEKLMAIQVP